MNYKICTICKVNKLFSEFYKHIRSKDGHASECKYCHNKRNQSYNQINRDEKLKRKKERYYKNHDNEILSRRKYKKNKKEEDYKLYILKRMLNSAKRRANKKNLYSDISIDDIPNFRTIEYCPIFPDIKLDWHANKMADNSLSLDRIDNSKGYIKGNVRIISLRANILRKNLTKEELEALLKYYEKYNLV